MFFKKNSKAGQKPYRILALWSWKLKPQLEAKDSKSKKHSIEAKKNK